MIELNADFAYCLKRFGMPLDGEAIAPGVVEAYRSRVPVSMNDFWRQAGFGIWLDGRFQIVRPDRYQGLLDVILEGDPDFPPEQCTLIGFGAFGRLLVWHNKNYCLEIDLVEKYALTDHLNTLHPVVGPDIELPMALGHVDRPTYDFHEHTNDARPLFSRAMKRCGKLAYGECYGFVPAVGLGGRGVLDEVQRVRALEHFSIIAQLAPIQLRYMDTEKRRIVVLRDLGG